MIITDTRTKELLLNNTIYRELVIHFPDDDIPDITDAQIVRESMRLKRSIIKGCEFKFGGGVASQFSIKVIGIEADLADKKIEVSLRQTVRPLLYPSEDLFPAEDLFPCGGTQSYEWRIFTGKIDSAPRMKNRAIKEITAFDDLCSNSKFIYEFLTQLSYRTPNCELINLREIIENQLNHDGDNAELQMFNDLTSLSLNLDNVKKVIKPKKTTSTDILIAYAELNASFLVADSYNKFKYVQLLNPNVEEITYYKDLEWEEYETAPITGSQFPYNGDSYYGFGYAPTSIYVSDNLLTKCCTDVSALVKNAYHKFKDAQCVFRPFKAVLFDYWWLEPGDKVIIHTGAKDTPTVTSFVFNITISGIHNIKVAINADGKQYIGKDEMSNAV